MAKGKHATALFEVIHAKNKALPARKSVTATPGWWFKAKAEKPGAAPLSGADAMAAARAELAIANAAVVAPEPRVVERIVEIEKPVYIDRPVPVPTRSLELDSDTLVQLDSANHEIKFRLSYLGAVAAGIVLILVLAMAYLFGTHASDVSLADPSGATGSTVGDTTSAAAPSPMIAAAAPPTITRTPAPQPAPDTEPARTEAPATPDANPTLSAAPPEPAPATVDRQIGLHYVIVQSYPEPETAQKATDFLNAHGIACTRIPGPPNWAPRGWYSVIGTEAFDHVQHNPELDAYLQSIDALATQFAGNKRFIRFKPAPYKWTERSDAR